MILTPTLAPQDERPVSETAQEALIARLARAAYDVAIRHGTRSPFVDLELGLWRELRSVVESEPSNVVRRSAS